jgi:hypothetical protein
MKTVYDLMCAVADHLAGKVVRVRLTRPDGADGLAWCDDLGRPTIDISSDLSDDLQLYVLLHEISHVRHHNFIPVTEKVMVITPLSTHKASYQIKEDQADRQAKVWLDYGKRHRDEDLPYFEGVLTALLTYYN